MLIDEELINKYQEYSFQRTIEVNPDLFSFCPTADCGYIFFWEKGDNPDFLCPKCDNRYCFKCRVDYHSSLSCEQYQKWAKENGKGDQLFEKLVEKQNYKKCPKCQRWVEKASGYEINYK
ncbi:hypothetical protein DICPUDRAFT_25641 [Dictyostelium purpureum]|uniref:RING-type domain-containing protein n=1 Tax=Dictyostelium purpureum TaxID=5786 RepID=F0Z7H2_DICPU|nr:uncharacterized protein DICPUDRAFT_25641 [Dictyostelium purpureum]EGC40176.1 hypothetical protein DICPUDRAFT_25641 [Dictyostelium purpureum]|eukprot:XP_003283366.1 hypothetical protein DICPUDRAFT_25641 [Dictyostelium purpureum]